MANQRGARGSSRVSSAKRPLVAPVKMTVLRGGSKRTMDITPEARDSVTLQQFPRVTGDDSGFSLAISIQLRRAGHFRREFLRIAASSGCDGCAVERSARGLLRGEGRSARLGSPREHTCCVRGRESRRRDHRCKWARRAIVDGLDAGSPRSRTWIDHRASGHTGSQGDDDEGDAAAAFAASSARGRHRPDLALRLRRLSRAAARLTGAAALAAGQPASAAASCAANRAVTARVAGSPSWPTRTSTARTPTHRSGPSIGAARALRSAWSPDTTCKVLVRQAAAVALSAARLIGPSRRMTCGA